MASENKIGITVGKFMPLHKGHELLIDFGSKMVDKFYVLVSGKVSDEIPVRKRYVWVCEYVAKNNLTNVTVLYHIDESPTPTNINEKGTVLDREFQSYWAGEFTRLVPHATHFVSSDYYGQSMAKMLGITWMPVDPNREIFDISATKIREKPMKYFDYISSVAKPYFTKRIAIVGAESSGKTTIAKKLSIKYKSPFVNEYGRTLSEAKENLLSEDDFLQIMYGQNALIEIAEQKTRVPSVFIDTEAYTTYLFSKLYLGNFSESILEYAKKQKIDHYIVLTPDLEWVNDGNRLLSEQKQREKFMKNLIDLLEENNESYSISKLENVEEMVSNL